jgi:hypothetical protein
MTKGGSRNYDKCPFCERTFERKPQISTGKLTEMDRHVIWTHKKVKVRKGKEIKWMNEMEVS